VQISLVTEIINKDNLKYVQRFYHYRDLINKECLGITIYK